MENFAQRRLLSIDSLRGLAAVAVVLHHVFLPHATNRLTGDTLELIGQVFTLGFSGVWLFIVISGFCIHLRTAAAMKEGSVPTIDFTGFWKRRIYRLYPAYLVALLLYIVIENVEGSLEFDGFFFYNLFLHLFMLHNLDGNTVHGYCGVFWSLALEEQLYLAYFVLLPLRQRSGWTITLIICFMARLITYAIHFALRNAIGVVLPTQAFVTSQWFVWALGALSVEAHYGLVKLPRWCRDFRIGLVVLGFTAFLIVYDRFTPDSVLRKPIWFLMDPLLACGFFVMVNYFVASEKRIGDYPQWCRAGISLLAFVGLFSYSLYLTHQMILIHLSNYLCSVFGFSHTTIALLTLSPLCLLLGWVFFCLFEKPFMGGTRKSLARTRYNIESLSGDPIPAVATDK